PFSSARPPHPVGGNARCTRRSPRAAALAGARGLDYPGGAVSEAQPITGLRADDVADTVFLCGDPARVARIAAGWEDVREVCAVREWRVATGIWEGRRLSAASTGVGAPSTAILVEELARVGART